MKVPVGIRKGYCTYPYFLVKYLSASLRCHLKPCLEMLRCSAMTRCAHYQYSAVQLSTVHTVCLPLLYSTLYSVQYTATCTATYCTVKGLQKYKLRDNPSKHTCFSILLPLSSVLSPPHGVPSYPYLSIINVIIVIIITIVMHHHRYFA